MSKLLIVAALTLSLFQTANAQDSIKRTAKPVVKPTAAKPGQPYGAKPYQANPYHAKPAAGYAQTPAAPAVGNPAAQQNPNAPTPVSTDKSLSGQYKYILSKTYHYQQPMISALWKNMNDTLRAERAKLKDATAKLAEQGKTTAALQSDLNNKSQSLDEANNRKDEISLLGIGMPKGTYNLIMWGLVIGMAVVLLIVIIRTAGNSREAKYRTKLFDELSEEFQAYKVKANDKEKKLARELQTERNKVDELMGRG